MALDNADGKVVMSTSPPDSEPTPPPQFDSIQASLVFGEKSGRDRSNNATNPSPHTHFDFPQVGELPIPNLSPMTVHVTSSTVNC